MIDLQECVNKYIELEEKRKMQEMKEKELIIKKETAMIMHPKHKGIVIQTGLKNVVFSKACEEDKAYLVTDEGLVQVLLSKEFIYEGE